MQELPPSVQSLGRSGRAQVVQKWDLHSRLAFMAWGADSEAYLEGVMEAAGGQAVAEGAMAGVVLVAEKGAGPVEGGCLQHKTLQVCTGRTQEVVFEF